MKKRSNTTQNVCYWINSKDFSSKSSNNVCLKINGEIVPKGLYHCEQRL